MAVLGEIPLMAQLAQQAIILRFIFHLLARSSLKHMVAAVVEVQFTMTGVTEEVEVEQGALGQSGQIVPEATGATLTYKARHTVTALEVVEEQALNLVEVVMPMEETLSLAEVAEEDGRVL